MIGDRICRWRWTAQHGVPAHHVSRIYESALAKRRIAFDIFYSQIQGSRHSVQSQQRTSELKLHINPFRAIECGLAFHNMGDISAAMGRNQQASICTFLGTYILEPSRATLWLSLKAQTLAWLR